MQLYQKAGGTYDCVPKSLTTRYCENGKSMFQCLRKEKKELFKKPTRLECMMQDYPKVLPQGAKVGFSSAPAFLCYSPCKNNSNDAAVSIANGIPAGSAYTGEELLII